MEKVGFEIVGSGFMKRNQAEVITHYCENSIYVAISGIVLAAFEFQQKQKITKLSRN
jgi:hypothetical protein